MVKTATIPRANTYPIYPYPTLPTMLKLTCMDCQKDITSDPDWFQHFDTNRCCTCEHSREEAMKELSEEERDAFIEATQQPDFNLACLV